MASKKPTGSSRILAMAEDYYALDRKLSEIEDLLDTTVNELYERIEALEKAAGIKSKERKRKKRNHDD